MKLSILMLLSAFSIFQAQAKDTIDCTISSDNESCLSEATNSDIGLLKSPVFWVNMGFVIWGLLSYLFLVSRFRNFCLVTYLKIRGKRINMLLFLVVAFMMVHPVLNVKWFYFEHTSKGKRLFNCLLSLSVFGLLCTLSIPHQVKDEYPLLQKPGFYIAVMPPLVDLYLAIGKLLFTTIIKLCFRLFRKVSDHAPIIGEIILAIITVTCLVIELIEVVGNDRLRSDIWKRNMAQGISPIWTIVPVIMVIVQMCVINSLKKTTTATNPEKYKRLTKMAMPEMVSLMELTMPPKKSNEIELLEV